MHVLIKSASNILMKLFKCVICLQDASFFYFSVRVNQKNLRPILKIVAHP